MRKVLEPTMLVRVCTAWWILLFAMSSAVAASPDDSGTALLEKIEHTSYLPKWKFLGVRTDNYGRNYYMFFGADTIRTAEKYLDVVIGAVEYRSGFATSPELFVSGVQQGKYKLGGLTIAQIDCTDELIAGYSDAKLFEDHVASFVCAHAPKSTAHH
jgi:hypothetical protein